MDLHAPGQVVAAGVEHRGPEQGVEVGDVLADHVDDAAVGALLPVAGEVAPVLVTEFLRRADVTHGGVEPHVEELVGLARDPEAEVGRIPGDVPRAQLVLQEVHLEPVAHLRMQVRLLGDPPGDLGARLLQVHEIVQRRAPGGVFLAQHAERVLQIRGIVGGAALLAGVSVLVGGPAAGAGTLDEAVRQEAPVLLAVILLDVLLVDQARLGQAREDALGVDAGLVGVGGVEAVEPDLEPGEVLEVTPVVFGDHLLWGDALLAGVDLDGRAVAVGGAHVHHVLAGELHGAHVDVGHQILDQVADVDVAVGVGKGGRDENAGHGGPLSGGAL